MYAEVIAALKGAILDPPLVFAIARDAISLRRKSAQLRSKTLIGTHHKVLTVYMMRVSRAFSLIAGQSYFRGTSPHVEYDKQVILDHHSTFDFSRVTEPFRGIHVRRDPRDVLVSSVLYHLKSAETWLHEEGRWGLQGSTYQKELRALSTMEKRLLFELDHEGGQIIDGMSSWDYSRPEFVELQYEQVVRPEGVHYIRDLLDQSALFDTTECMLLEKLFKIFSTRGVLAHKRHIRDARPSQWQEHFTPTVEARFQERFGQALIKLGYA